MERWLGVEVWLEVEAPPRLAALRLAAFDDGVYKDIVPEARVVMME